MALSQSVASELLEAFRAGEGVDLVRESVRLVMQELIETEASERIGGNRYERTETRITDRNGSRPRLLATQAGDVQLRIPKLRKGSFFPVILEPRRRIDQALYAVVMEAHVNGVSTRAVDDLMTALGIDSGISKSEVSRTRWRRGGGVGLGEDRAEYGGDHVLVGLGHQRQQVTGEVHPAALVAGPLQDAAQRGYQADRCAGRRPPAGCRGGRVHSRSAGSRARTPHLRNRPHRRPTLPGRRWR